MKKLEVEKTVTTHRLLVNEEDVLSLLKRCKEVPRMDSSKFEIIDSDEALLVIEWTETSRTINGNEVEPSPPSLASNTTLDHDGEEA